MSDTAVVAVYVIRLEISDLFPAYLQILRPLCGDIIICNHPVITQTGPSFMKLVMESMTYVSSLTQASLMMEAIGALSSFYKGPSHVTDAFLRAGKIFFCAYCNDRPCLDRLAASVVPKLWQMTLPVALNSDASMRLYHD